MNCGILTEGYDDWRVSCIVLARPTTSEGLYTQIIGRGTRIPSDIENLKVALKNAQTIAKDDRIIVDFVDATSKHSLVTLPTLFGLGKHTDLKGEKISSVVDAVQKLKDKNPALDLSGLEDITKLEAYAQQVDLFKGAFSREIIQISQLQWHRTREHAYAVALLKNESVVVLKDMLGKWHMVGRVNGYELKEVRPSLDEAIHEADYQINLRGGEGLLGGKPAVPSKKTPPFPAQLSLCRRLKLEVPSEATHAEVSRRLAKFFQDRGKARLARNRTTAERQ